MLTDITICRAVLSKGLFLLQNQSSKAIQTSAKNVEFLKHPIFEFCLFLQRYEQEVLILSAQVIDGSKVLANPPDLLGVSGWSRLAGSGDR